MPQAERQKAKHGKAKLDREGREGGNQAKARGLGQRRKAGSRFLIGRLVAA